MIRPFGKLVYSIVLLFVLSLVCSTTHAAEDDFSPGEKQFLLDLARQTLCWYAEDRSIPTVEDKYLTPKLLANEGCFVTLDSKEKRYALYGGLRGCMGMFAPVTTPLYKNVIDRTIAAAARDPRFPPVKYSELKDIKIEISVLTTPEELDFSSPEDLLAKLKPLEDGVILITGYGSSTYLPQVWEQLPEKEEFLSRLCLKHGAPADYWRTNYINLRVQIFKVAHFAEQMYGRIVVGKNGAVVGKGGGVVLGHVLPLGGEKEDEAHSVKEGQAVREGQKLSPGTIVTPKTPLLPLQRS
ncbi:AmmeMemoRadiSam system protein A [Candidatus Omnitrophota bacterium]